MGVDEQCDVAVLRTSTAKLSHLTSNYGFGNVLVGGVGRALGFPAISDPRDMSHVAQVGGAPIPLGVLVASYFLPPTEASVHYLGGYANSGFSGGAVVLPTIQGAWTIAGIITHREDVPKGTIYGKDAETGRWVLRDDLCLKEPSGVIRFAGFGVVTNLIEGVANGWVVSTASQKSLESQNGLWQTFGAADRVYEQPSLLEQRPLFPFKGGALMQKPS